MWGGNVEDKNLFSACKFCGLRHTERITCESAEELRKAVSEIRALPHSHFFKYKSPEAVREETLQADKQFLSDLAIAPVEWENGRIVV
jgi:hypothetical protein